jgi:hypothetical protein
MINYKEVLEEILDPLKFDQIKLTDTSCYVQRKLDNRIFRLESNGSNPNLAYKMFLGMLVEPHPKYGGE